MALTWIPWDVAMEAGAVVGTAGIAGRGVTHKWLAGAARFRARACDRARALRAVAHHRHDLGGEGR